MLGVRPGSDAAVILGELLNLAYLLLLDLQNNSSFRGGRGLLGL